MTSAINRLIGTSQSGLILIVYDVLNTGDVMNVKGQRRDLECPPPFRAEHYQRCMELMLECRSVCHCFIGQDTFFVCG